MIPGQFDYVRPGDLTEALRILTDREGEAKVLSGGYSLLPLIKLRLAQPGLLVDIGRVAGLDGIVETDDELRIGGRATHRAIAENATIQAGYPLLAETAIGIGDPQVRNWGTIGGSVAHADPSADWPAVLLAARGSVVLRSAAGERVVPARGFFIDAFETGIEPTEILTEVRIPRTHAHSAGAYRKLERRTGDFATVGVAAKLKLDNGTIGEAGIGVTAVAPAPFAATDAEAELVGNPPSDELFRRAGLAAAAMSQPVADGHGPPDYKRAMVTEMTIRALRAAAERASSG
jgi:aerobic carbon-monoxide dehydrogenase medium subunit